MCGNSYRHDKMSWGSMIACSHSRLPPRRCCCSVSCTWMGALWLTTLKLGIIWLGFSQKHVTIRCRATFGENKKHIIESKKLGHWTLATPVRNSGKTMPAKWFETSGIFGDAEHFQNKIMLLKIGERLEEIQRHYLPPRLGTGPLVQWSFQAPPTTAFKPFMQLQPVSWGKLKAMVISKRTQLMNIIVSEICFPLV